MNVGLNTIYSLLVTVKGIYSLFIFKLLYLLTVSVEVIQWIKIVNRYKTPNTYELIYTLNVVDQNTFDYKGFTIYSTFLRTFLLYPMHIVIITIVFIVLLPSSLRSKPSVFIFVTKFFW